MDRERVVNLAKTAEDLPKKGSWVRRSLLEYRYLLLLGAFVPLFVQAWHHPEVQEPGIFARISRSLDAHPEVRERISMSDAPPQTLNDLLEFFPGRRLDGAFLARDSWLHWGFALASAGAFFGLLMALPKAARAAKSLFWVGLFTATVGVFLLISFQHVANWTYGRWVTGHPVLMIAFYIAKFIGFSYRAASDPASGLAASFVGFVCGVGLCEEFCKSLPLIVHYRTRGSFSWKMALLVGFASGIGFGAAEGIIYSRELYNGIMGSDAYLVRFTSCVALHMVWSGSAGLALCRVRDSLPKAEGWVQWSWVILRALAVPIILHGLYDTLLKRELAMDALLIAMVSFGFLVLQVQMWRAAEKYQELHEPVLAA